MKANFHTHTFRCLHAYGNEQDYILEAIEKGLEVIGFSDHAPFPDIDYGLRMKFDDLPEHLAEVDKMKKKYSGRIKIYKGLEIEYHPQYIDYYRSLLSDSGLDYLLLGEHMYTCEGRLKNIFFAESTDDYVEYAENIAQAASTGLFSCIAHPDIMMLNDFARDENCDKASDIILDAAQEYDVILEYNANGFRRGLHKYSDGVRFPYPDERFWKSVSERGLKTIIGSDCHIPGQVCDKAVELSEKEAKKLGLNLTESMIR